MKALIVEFALGGHRPYYVSVLARELIRLGIETCVACPEHEFETPLFKMHLADLMLDAEFIGLERLPEHGRNSYRALELKQLRALANTVKPDHLYVPFADVICRQTGIPGIRGVGGLAQVVEGLVMNSPLAYSDAGIFYQLKAAWVDRAIRKGQWTRLHTLDPLSWECLRATGGDSIFLLPEAIEPTAEVSKSEARKALSLSASRQIITCPGGVHERKGSHLLIEALRHLSDDVSLVLAGRHSPFMIDYIESNCRDLIRSGRLLARNECLPESGFQCLFDASDVVAVPYPRHRGSASILIRAASAGCRIVASDFGWVGWATRQFDLGVACDVTDSLALSTAIGTQLTRCSNHQVSKRHGEFVSYHTLENHLAWWTELIGTKAGVTTRRKTSFPHETRDHAAISRKAA